MSNRKKPRSWQKLMRQREQERNRFGGAHQAFSAIVHIDDDDIEFDEDHEDDDEDEAENNRDYEHRRAESI